MATISLRSLARSLRRSTSRARSCFFRSSYSRRTRSFRCRSSCTRRYSSSSFAFSSASFFACSRASLSAMRFSRAFSSACSTVLDNGFAITALACFDCCSQYALERPNADVAAPCSLAAFSSAISAFLRLRSRPNRSCAMPWSRATNTEALGRRRSSPTLHLDAWALSAGTDLKSLRPHRGQVWLVPPAFSDPWKVCAMMLSSSSSLSSKLRRPMFIPATGHAPTVLVQAVGGSRSGMTK